MAQRNSGYRRKRNDAYFTPSWVTEALLPHIPKRINQVWEPACGRGAIADVLRKRIQLIHRTDLNTGHDFLTTKHENDSVITNPPYGLAEEFIRRALEVTWKRRGFVAMLLATDFDHAKRRQYLFGGCPQFAKKLVLTKRIVWFKKVIASPSSNHAWFMWDWKQTSPPTIAYYYENN